MEEEGAPVDLYIYDLSLGFASVLAPAIIGRAVEGVWHTAVVAYDREHYYGGGGVVTCAPGSTQLGAPCRVERLGRTQVPHRLFRDYLQGLAASSYSGAAYNLLEHNCNHFSEEVAQFLCGAHVPKHILRQPDELLAPQHRAALQLLLDPLHQQAETGGGRRDSPDYTTLNDQIEEARAQAARLEQRRTALADKLARKQRRRDKKRRRHSPQHSPEPHDMAEAVSVSRAGAEEAPGEEAEVDERTRLELARRRRDPPALDHRLDAVAECAALAALLDGEEHAGALDELRQYAAGEGSWVLGDDFLEWCGGVLRAGGAPAPQLLRALAALAARDDLPLLLHQDRRHHALLHYAAGIDTLPLDQQRALALFMCNLFENISSSEWLLYISEWEVEGKRLCNIVVTTKVCVHAALSEDEELRALGAALMYNVATREVKTVRWRRGKALRDLLPRRAAMKVFDEVCVELAMALLQALSGAPAERELYRLTRALALLCAHARDVPQLVAVVGPHPAAYRGTSTRVDEQIAEIEARCPPPAAH